MSPRLSVGYIFYDRIVSFQNLWKIPLQEKHTGPVFLFLHWQKCTYLRSFI